MIGIMIDVSGQPEKNVVAVRTFIGSRRFLNVAGYEGQRTVREHLQNLDDTRVNKLGGQRTHYYGNARKATEYRVEGELVIINIAQVGMNLHYHGGTVTAGKGASWATGNPTKYLTIPARAEAHGKTASDFPNLVIVWGRNRKPVGLAVGVPSDAGSLYGAVSRRHGPMLTLEPRLVPGLMMFWLKESVTLQPDPSVLPTEEKLGTNIRDRLGRAIARRFAGQDVTGGFEEGAGI